MDNKIIAVDFDGTLCENAYPEIGHPKYAVINYVRRQKMQGAKLILWTNRSGVCLQEAIRWCKQFGIVFDAINENIPEMVEFFNGDCRKVFANEYLDDRAIPLPVERSLAEDQCRAFYYIREHLGKCELLAQLAEESAELAQAALKYRRVLDGGNPTPVTMTKAIENLIEEIADVDLCVSLLNTSHYDAEIAEIKNRKIERWIDRLKEAAQNG